MLRAFLLGCLLMMSVTAQARDVRVFVAGDSTASNYGPEVAPRMGWGQALPAFFDKGVEVVNLAQSGRSSKSFIAEGWFAKIGERIGQGDYLLIQFGHNDEKRGDQARYTDPSDEFPATLKRYLDMARKAGATPVLITPVARRNFKGGSVSESHGAWREAVLDLAKAEKVALIDLGQKSLDFFNDIGTEPSRQYFLHLPKGSSNYPDGVEDNTHFQQKGAEAMAKLVVQGLRENKLPLVQYLKPAQ